MVAALGVVLVMASITAASASAALPEFGSSGFNKFPDKFSVSGGSFSFQQASGGSGICGSASGSGSFTGHKSGTIILNFASCGNLPRFCHGQNATEMNILELEMFPFYISKSEHKVGVELKPKTGTTVAKLWQGASQDCLLKGSIVGLITPVNSLTKTYTLSFIATSGAHQSPNFYENEKGELVNSWLEIGEGGFIGEKLWEVPSSFERYSWNGSATLAAETAIEIKA